MLESGDPAVHTAVAVTRRACAPWSTLARFLLLCLGLLCLCAAPVRADTVTTVDRHTVEADFGLRTQYFHDAGQTLSAEQVIARDAQLPWQALNSKFINLGFQDGAFWFKADIRNADSQPVDFILEEPYPLIDALSVRVVHDGTILQRYDTGDHLPFAQRPLRHPEFLFPVTIPAASTVTLLVRVQNTEALEAPLTLWNTRHYHAHNNAKGKIEGIFYGFMIVMALYNLVLYVFIRDRNYLYYVLFVVSFVMTFAVQRGDFYAWLYPDSPWLAHYLVPLSLLVSYSSAVVFFRAFLRTREQLPRWDLAVRLVLLACIALTVAPFVLPYRIAVIMVVVIQLPLAVLALSMSTILSRRGQRTAQIYLAAWTLLLTNLAGNTLAKIGLIQNDFFYIYGLRLGAAIEVVLFSLALAYRYREEKEARLRTEQALSQERQNKLDAQQLAFDSEKELREIREAMLQQQRQINERLERMVQERTAALEAANFKLKEMNAIDGLTQVNNRRFFEETLASEWNKAARSPDEMCLLMIDGDRFKTINDTHGHLCGDACLKHMAAIFRRSVNRAGDFVARYGGEEFVLLLCNTKLEGAALIAERIRTQIANTPMEWEGELLHFTVSIGVSSRLPKPFVDMTILVKEADAACYAAKTAGRNCVMLYRKNPEGSVPDHQILRYNPQTALSPADPSH